MPVTSGGSQYLEEWNVIICIFSVRGELLFFKS